MKQSLECNRLLGGLHLIAVGGKPSASFEQHDDVLLFAGFIAHRTALALGHKLCDALQTQNVPTFPQTATLRGIGQHLIARRALKEPTAAIHLRLH